LAITKPARAAVVERRREQLDPQVVGVVGARKIGKAPIVLQLRLVDAIDVERRIRHHEVEPANALVQVLVIAIALADLARQPVDREVHLRQPHGLAGLLLPVDRQLVARRAAVTLDEVGRLHEHPARPARRVEDPTVERLDDLDNQPHDRHRREELARALPLGERELAQEVLVDQPECVAF
jgi:hypothetical protein